MAWNTILNFNTVDSTSWLHSEKTISQLFCVSQVNPPDYGRITISQLISDVHNQKQSFPASIDKFSLHLSYGSDVPRTIAVKARCIQKLDVPWEITLQQLTPAIDDVDNILIQVFQQTNAIRWVDLQFVRTEINPEEPTLIDTYFWVSVNAATSNYGIGQFITDDEFNLFPKIVTPLQPSGFFVVFTGVDIETRKVRVLILNL
ncbi:MAG: hypothetical protein F6K63_29945 [Moorea sp. SIO1G6]|uniref:hypothetical protein n=1 Tax=Moorena sp. SIO1G6 TaxID=2607840 RepID=UPI0013C113EE|nr:hypothetical protein [Moorena sp. SIO1G6]NET68393.1 hypothetical protein [Moorena sp. SIO1G6]